MKLLLQQQHNGDPAAVQLSIAVAAAIMEGVHVVLRPGHINVEAAAAAVRARLDCARSTLDAYLAANTQLEAATWIAGWYEIADLSAQCVELALNNEIVDMDNRALARELGSEEPCEEWAALVLRSL